MNKILNISTLLFFLLFSTNSYCQLWPGDVNNNGVVNGVDILYIGQVWHLEGPTRNPVDSLTSWESVGYNPWDGMFDNGVNHAFADCNADGEVDEDDIEDVILPNFYQEHGTVIEDVYDNGVPGQDVELRLTPVEGTVVDGDPIEVVLELGTEENPVSNFNGINLVLSFTPGMLSGEEEDNYGLNFDLDLASWLDDMAEDSLEVTMHVDPLLARADLSIIKRRDVSEPSNGYGTVGSFFVIIEDIVVGDALDTFNIKVENVMMVDDNFTSSPVVTDETDVMIVGEDYLSSTENNNLTNLNKDIKVNPNPAGNYVTVKVPDYAKVEEVTLMNSVGQQFVLDNYAGKGHFTINLEQYASGIYYLNLKTANEIVNRVILINK